MDDGTLDQGTLGAALEREHREIDDGILAFTSGVAAGRADTEPLIRAIDALRRHIYLEEAFLFPPMRPQLAIPMSVMLREHGELWNTLDTLEATLSAGGDGNAARDVCRELLAQLERHNSKEEPIFYTQADAVLTPSASSQLQGFLESGEMPEGWVCERAAGVSRSS